MAPSGISSEWRDQQKSHMHRVILKPTKASTKTRLVDGSRGLSFMIFICVKKTCIMCVYILLQYMYISLFIIHILLAYIIQLFVFLSKNIYIYTLQKRNKSIVLG